MKSRLLFILPFLLTTFLSAQKKKEIKKYGIQSAVTTESQGDKSFVDSKELFGSDGRTAEHISYDKNGKLKKTLRYKYNEKGKISEEQEFDENNELKETRRFTYNSLDEKSGELVLDKSGTQVKKIVYLYDNRGLRTERRMFDANNRLISVKKTEYKFK
jgi:hypothetical protein